MDTFEVTLLTDYWFPHECVVMFLNDPLDHYLEYLESVFLCAGGLAAGQLLSLLWLWVRAVSVGQPSTKNEKKNGRGDWEGDF